MGLVSKTIPGFYNGISQQAAPLRLPTQTEEQINCFSNLVDGITKRPNTEHLATLTSNAAAGCMVHEINRDADDQYIMIITGDASEPVEVFRLDTGVKCTIRYGILNKDEERTNCLFSHATDFFTSIAHGLEDDQQINLTGELSPEYSSLVQYYVINKTADTFQVSLTSGGAAVLGTEDGGIVTWRLEWTEDEGVKGYFHQLDELNPNEVFKAITLADATYILNKNVKPNMAGSTKAGSLAGRVQTITDLPTGAGIPAADTSNTVAGSMSYQTQLGEDEAGTWVTFLDLLSTGHMTFGFNFNYLSRSTEEGAVRLEFQWVAQGAGWAAPKIQYVWFFGNTYVAHNKYFQLPIGADNWDIRVRRIGTFYGLAPEHDGYGSGNDPNWEGCNIISWSTGSDIYEITGAADTSGNSFYLQHDGDVWLETLMPGLQDALSPSSMPHILELTSPNEFTFSIAAWDDRSVGDDDTAPLPSFVNKTVDNITFFKNRFGMLSQENIILSKLGTDNFYGFFPTSSIQVLDDDPIDVPATSGNIAPIRSSVVYDKDLLLLSDQKQFTLSSGDKALSPTTVAITPTTNYDICRKCEPTSAGANVYFISPKLDYVSLREYMILPDSLVTDAADVTAHVPNYIPRGDMMIVKALNAFDCLFIWTDAEPESIFIYKFYWLGNEKPQSSWSKWTFDGEVLGMATLDSYLTLVVERENGEVCLEKMYLEPEQSGTLTWRVALDRRELLTGVYADGVTTWTASADMLAYTEEVPLKDIGYTLADEDTGFSTPYLTVVSATEIQKSGDFSDKDYYLGKSFLSYFDPTPWYLKDKEGVAITEGRIQIRTLTLAYNNTAYFQVKITPKGREPLIHTFVSDIIGVSKIDAMTLVTGEKAFQIMAQVKDTGIRIQSDSYLPMQFSVGSWKGSYHPKAKVM